jgi:hypothetical protein
MRECEEVVHPALDITACQCEEGWGEQGQEEGKRRKRSRT